MNAPDGFADWQVSPNIVGDPETYERENEALRRDGTLDRSLQAIAPWEGRRLVDVGCGTGFWLPGYAQSAASVIGVEPDLRLLDLAEERTAGISNLEVRHGSAEHLPVADGVADVVHARFAYFFGVGADAGLDEVRRILAPDATLLAVDNSWSGGDFARLLRAATRGNAAIDPDEARQWWADRGAVRHEVEGGWQATSRSELDRILRIEFPAQVVTNFMQNHHRPSLSYHFAIYEWRPR